MGDKGREEKIHRYRKVERERKREE